MISPQAPHELRSQTFLLSITKTSYTPVEAHTVFGCHRMYTCSPSKNRHHRQRPRSRCSVYQSNVSRSTYRRRSGSVRPKPVQFLSWKPANSHFVVALLSWVPVSTLLQVGCFAPPGGFAGRAMSVDRPPRTQSDLLILCCTSSHGWGNATRNAILCAEPWQS
jgi:hypothetical protein